MEFLNNIPDEVNMMRGLLENQKEDEFLATFSAFQESLRENGGNGNSNTTRIDSNQMKKNYCLLLNVAVKNGCDKAVKELLKTNVDVNKKHEDFNFTQPPAFVACYYGYYKILKLLLQKQELEISFKDTKRTILIEVCFQLGTREINDNRNYLKCLDLLLKDPRCLEKINDTDDIGCTALHYAIHNHNHEATKKLLNKFAFIGTQNNFGELAISNISHTVFEEVLDNCITVTESKDKKKNMEINYNLLKSPKYEKEQQDQEIALLNYIYEFPDLRYLIKHPVLSSFLYLKWQKLSSLLFVYFIFFTIILGNFVIFFVFFDTDREKGITYYLLYPIMFLDIIIITARVVFKYNLSRRSCICKLLKNWYTILLIALALVVLIKFGLSEEILRIFRALVILLAANEFLLLVGLLPYFSISTHMVILSKVWKTFWHSFLLYGIPVIAFAMSFYSLFAGAKSKNDDEDSGKKENSKIDEAKFKNNAEDKGKEKNSTNNETNIIFDRFENPGISIIKTIVMLTGEFNATSFDVNDIGLWIIFLLFVFMIAIVLFNLLNALAVSDTQIIKSDAELADLSQRIKVLNRYETMVFNPRNKKCCFGCLNYFCNKMKRYNISIFDSVIPSGKITIKPHSDNEIYTMIPKERSMYENLDCNILLDAVIMRSNNTESEGGRDSNENQGCNILLDEVITSGQITINKRSNYAGGGVERGRRSNENLDYNILLDAVIRRSNNTGSEGGRDSNENQGCNILLDEVITSGQITINKRSNYAGGGVECGRRSNENLDCNILLDAVIRRSNNTGSEGGRDSNENQGCNILLDEVITSGQITINTRSNNAGSENENQECNSNSQLNSVITSGQITINRRPNNAREGEERESNENLDWNILFNSEITSGQITINRRSNNAGDESERLLNENNDCNIQIKSVIKRQKTKINEEERLLYESKYNRCNKIIILLKSLMKFSTMDKKTMKKIHVVLKESRQRKHEQEKNAKQTKSIEAIEKSLNDLLNKFRES